MLLNFQKYFLKLKWLIIYLLLFIGFQTVENQFEIDL